jgi:hypothetical protein
VTPRCRRSRRLCTENRARPAEQSLLSISRYCPMFAERLGKEWGPGGIRCLPLAADSLLGLVGQMGSL